MRKIRKGDRVKVLSGKDKGRIGVILKLVTKSTGLWVVVEGMNVKKKHVKPDPQRQKPGGIIPREAPMPVCKVGLVDPTTGKESRVGIKTLADGRKVRFFKSSGEVVDV